MFSYSFLIEENVENDKAHHVGKLPLLPTVSRQTISWDLLSKIYLWSYIISLSGHKTFKDLSLFFIWKREGDLENFGYVDKISLIPALRL